MDIVAGPSHHAQNLRSSSESQDRLSVGLREARQKRRRIYGGCESTSDGWMPITRNTEFDLALFSFRQSVIGLEKETTVCLDYKLEIIDYN